MSGDGVVEVARALEAKIDALVAEHERGRENGDGMVARVVVSVLVAAIVGLFGFILAVSNNQVRNEERIMVLERREVPAPEVRQRLSEHERRLEVIERTNGREP